MSLIFSPVDALAGDYCKVYRDSGPKFFKEPHKDKNTHLHGRVDSESLVTFVSLFLQMGN